MRKIGKANTMSLLSEACKQMESRQRSQENSGRNVFSSKVFSTLSTE